MISVLGMTETVESPAKQNQIPALLPCTCPRDRTDSTCRPVPWAPALGAVPWFSFWTEQEHNMARLQQCPCGSGKFPEALYDGHNIFMCYVCDDCKAEKVAGFRPDIFEN